MGILVFSPFSSIITLDYLKLPLALPELLFIPFIFIINNKVNILSITKQKRTYILIILYLTLLFLAILIGDYLPFDILSSSRGYLYIGLFYLIFCKKNNFTLNDTLFVTFGSLIGWAVVSYINLQKSFVSAEEIISYGALLAIPLFISISLYKKNYSIFIIGMICIIFVSLTAGLRRQMAIVILSLLFTVFFLLLNNPKRFFSVSILIILLFIPLSISLPRIETLLKENAPVIYHRVFVRTEILLKGEKTGGDVTRNNNFIYLKDNLDSYIFPRGFVSKHTLKVKGTGRYIDFPLLELFHVLSIPLALLMILYFLHYAIKCTIMLLKYKSDGAFVALISFLIILSLLFLEGTFITYAYATPFTGLCLGMLKYYSKPSSLTTI